MIKRYFFKYNDESDFLFMLLLGEDVDSDLAFSVEERDSNGFTNLKFSGAKGQAKKLRYIFELTLNDKSSMQKELEGQFNVIIKPDSKVTSEENLVLVNIGDNSENVRVIDFSKSNSLITFKMEHSLEKHGIVIVELGDTSFPIWGIVLLVATALLIIIIPTSVCTALMKKKKRRKKKNDLEEGAKTDITVSSTTVSDSDIEEKEKSAIKKI